MLGCLITEAVISACSANLAQGLYILMGKLPPQSLVCFTNSLSTWNFWELIERLGQWYLGETNIQTDVETVCMARHGSCGYTEMNMISCLTYMEAQVYGTGQQQLYMQAEVG